jgi:single-strand DNA-binding protein
MFSLNRATIIGNLTRDPELRYTPNGQTVASFSIATNRRWTTPQGETQDATEFHEIVVWGKLAELSQQILTKGKRAYVEGRLQTRSWDAPDGSKRQRTEIVAENIIALSPREGGASSSSDMQFSAPASSPAPTPKPTSRPKKGSEPADAAPAPSEGEIDLSDLPF